VAGRQVFRHPNVRKLTQRQFTYMRSVTCGYLLISIYRFISKREAQVLSIKQPLKSDLEVVDREELYRASDFLMKRRQLTL